MKVLCNYLLITVSLVLLLSTVVSCNSSTKKDSVNSSLVYNLDYAPIFNELNENELNTLESSTSTIMLYFHTSRRCTTCKNVEVNSGKVFYDLFKYQIELGEFIYVIVNLDDANSKEIAQKYGVGGQSLIIVRGDIVKNITAEAFLNSKNINGLTNLISKTIKTL